jgi:hypothetical protein
MGPGVPLPRCLSLTRNRRALRTVCTTSILMGVSIDPTRTVAHVPSGPVRARRRAAPGPSDCPVESPRAPPPHTTPSACLSGACHAPCAAKARRRSKKQEEARRDGSRGECARYEGQGHHGIPFVVEDRSRSLARASGASFLPKAALSQLIVSDRAVTIHFACMLAPFRAGGVVVASPRTSRTWSNVLALPYV